MYSYKATIFGVPIKEILVVSAILCVSIIGIRINLFFTIGAALTSLALFITGKNRSWRFSALSFPRHGSRRRTFYPNVAKELFNGHMFVLTRQIVSVFAEITGQNLLAMRDPDQELVLRGIQTAIKDNEPDMDFISLHEPGNEEGRKTQTYAFKTYVRLSSPFDRRDRESILFSLTSSFSVLERNLENCGFHVREIGSWEEISRLMSALLP